jgi:hypothetical protein
MISFCTFMARALYGFHAGTPRKNIFSQTIYFEKRGMRSGTVTAVILIIQSMISCSWIIPYCYQSWACYGCENIQPNFLAAVTSKHLVLS